MARRVSKRKRSSKEDYPISEQLKIEEGVFDNRTMLRIRKLFSHNIISKFEFIIAKGKEGDVYLADSGSGIVEKEFVAVKIFRLETSSFEKRVDYIAGDPRFGRIKGGIFNIVSEWCKKEYGNLRIAEAAGVHAPKPYLYSGNVLAMEFIGEDGKPSQTLREAEVENPEAVLTTILGDVRKLYSRDLVHADLSEYNILMKKGVPYMIDFGQAVVIGHPKVEEFLERDVANILNYFRKKYEIEKNNGEVLSQIRSARS